MPACSNTTAISRSRPYLVEPPVIRNTLTEVLCKAGIHEYAVSETQKFGHVTYFWNGNRSGKVDDKLEVYEEIPPTSFPLTRHRP
jgi:2,3-bisphosphoglycerate-independent phosphoglycerate mutase